jgi:hypothetical protein
MKGVTGHFGTLQRRVNLGGQLAYVVSALSGWRCALLLFLTSFCACF